MPNKREKKQFPIKDIDTCKIYLRKIITVAESCRYSMECYLKEGDISLAQMKEKKTTVVPYLAYSDVLRKLFGVESYVLNVFGDLQVSSVSYMKFRKQVEKLESNGIHIGLPELSEDASEALKGFNKARNFENHIPESVLVAEQEMIAEGIAIPETEDPLEVYLPAAVTLDYFEDLVTEYRKLYDGVKLLIDSAMKDYNALYGKNIELKIVFTDSIVGTSRLEVGKRAAKAQG